MITLLLVFLSLFAQGEAFLEMDYDTFDQTDNGWRSLAYEERYLDAARLIDRYTDANRDDLMSDEVRLLDFHSGQMYAFANEYIRAVERFETSYKPPYPVGETDVFTSRWNAYIDATIAFLEGDLDALLAQRELMGQGESLEGSNRTVIDKLIENFGKPYSEAYGD